VVYYSAGKVAETERINMVAIRMNPKKYRAYKHRNFSLKNRKYQFPLWGVLAYWVTIGERSQGKTRGFALYSVGSYGHASVEDTGVLVLYFRRK